METERDPELADRNKIPTLARDGREIIIMGTETYFNGSEWCS